MPPAVGAWSLNHWTTRKPQCCFDSCSFVISSEVLGGGGVIMSPVLFFILRIALTVLGLWIPYKFQDYLFQFCDSFITLCVCVCVCVRAHMLNCSVTSDLFQPHGLQPTRLLYPWTLPGHWKGGVPLSTPGDLPNLAIKSASLASPALAGGFFTTSATQEAIFYQAYCSDCYHGISFPILLLSTYFYCV